jgi:hypothetical protein
MRFQHITQVISLRWLFSLIGTLLSVELFAAPDFVKEVWAHSGTELFLCHGPDKQKSGYRLDVRDIALKGGDSGKTAIVPHSAKDSPLIRFISGEDPEIAMPPKKSDAPRLTAAEIQILREWVDAGPAWPDAFAGERRGTNTLWSLTPLVKPSLLLLKATRLTLSFERNWQPRISTCA